MSLRPDVKADWVAALRSGEYEQGFNALYDEANDGYCCLGVLGCELKKKFPEVLEQSGWNFDEESGVFLSRTITSDKMLIDSHLPDSVATAIGLDGGSGLHPFDAGRSLVTINDEEGRYFPEIADIIEELY